MRNIFYKKINLGIFLSSLMQLCHADYAYYEATGGGKSTTGPNIGTACASLAGMTGFKYRSYTSYGLHNGDCIGTRPYSGEVWIVGKYKRLIECDVGKFNSQLNRCTSSADNGQPDTSQLCPMVGNPINFTTGNKYHEEVYAFTTDRGLDFKRFYNSSDATWRHSYSDKIIAQKEQITLIMSDGKNLHYNLEGNPADDASASWGKMTPLQSGWRFMEKNQKTYEFDAQGRLISVRDNNSKLYNLSYTALSNADNIEVIVSSEYGNRFSFKQYLGNLYFLSMSGAEFSFTYSTEKQLTKVVKLIGGKQYTRLYHYEDARGPLNLTGITDERGVRYATWRYDEQSRAISSEHAGGVDKVSINYNIDGSTTITNELGKKTTYRFQIINGRKHIISIDGEISANCPNSNSTFTYDDHGLMKTKTDNKGHLTTYEYNDRALEVSRTETAGTPQARTITTEWHPTLFVRTKVTEPTRINTYSYDEQGRKLSQSVMQR